MGYVLGALDATEQHQVQQWIDSHPELEYELLAIKSSLAPLEYLEPLVGPPPGLARRACQAIAVVERTLPRDVEPQSPTGSSFPLMQAVAQQALRERRQSPATSVGGWGQQRLKAGRGLSWVDLAFSCSAALIVGALLMPALAVVRFNSRLVHCQDNLRSIYAAWTGFAQDNDGVFMRIPPSGRLNMVGVFAPTLIDREYLHDDRVFFCPGLGSDLSDCRVPKLRELEETPCPIQFAAHCKSLCGNYACNLGYVDVSDRFVCPNVQGFSNHVLLADSPSCTGIAGMSRNHDRRRINAIKGNGAITTLTNASIGNDALYYSDRNLVEAGRHIMDTVVGCGSVRLFPDSH